MGQRLRIHPHSAQGLKRWQQKMLGWSACQFCQHRSARCDRANRPGGRAKGADKVPSPRVLTVARAYPVLGSVCFHVSSPP